MKLLGQLLGAVAVLSATACALGGKATLSFNGTSGLQLAGKNGSAQIVLDGRDWPGVVRTAHDLATDFGRVTGTNGTVSLHNGTNSTMGIYRPSASGIIIAGTIGNSSIIDSLVSAGKLDVSKVKGQWEAYISQIVSNPMPGVSSALVIAGADKRGSIYGLYDISEQIGVSPWYWWADVPAKKKSKIYATNTTKIQKSPSVKYRGFFINDEQPALTNWVQDNYPNGKYGPGFNADFYAHVFELLLRLKANYIWPAEWNSMLAVDDPRSLPLADMMGVVMGTSHTEPLARWTPEQSRFLDGPWSWLNNRNNVIEFMREGVKRSAPYETMWTMGMRGLGDTVSPTLNSSQLEDIINVQQGILRDTLNLNSTEDLPMMWCLYKEVGGYFQDGMDVPEDITLLWAEDNWGNNQRLPYANETSRKGGAGVYYHFDYVGDVRDYKWINTISLQKTWEQMHLAYERQARKIWIVNVGDLKPLEVLISHFFDLAYDMPSMSSPDSTSKWLKLWAEREFGPEVADDAATAMNTYGFLAARRKYELLDPTIYSIDNYGEADTVLGEWKDLVDLAQGIYDKLDDATKVAFFELVLQPSLSGYAVHQVHINAAKNQEYAYEWRTSANTYAQRTLDAFAEDASITKRYHSLLNGKWNHILDQTHIGYNWWQQPMRNVAPALSYTQATEVSLGGEMGVTAEAHNGSAPGDSIYNPANSNSTQIMPPLDPYGPSSRYLDIYSRGPGTFSYKVSTGASWVTATPSSGSLSGTGNASDQRVRFSVDFASAPPGTTWVQINVTSSSNYGSFGAPIAWLPVHNTAVSSSFHGFVESDGHVSMEAEHTSLNTSAGNTSYQIIPGYGRTLSGVQLTPVTADSQNPGSGPRLEYKFFAFSSVDNANVTMYTGTGLNTLLYRPLKYALALDDGEPLVKQAVPGYRLGQFPLPWWTKATADAAFVNSTTVGRVEGGEHTLKVWLLEPGLVLQKLVLDLGGVRASYLGPPESVRI
ncbi:MAG: hypothetical protein MMC23_002564 [Stictis urceolatum]|nr:hypothetical protein [Stictis urceolata]